MIEELKIRWINLASKYIEKPTLVISLWEDILKHYSKKNRYYHNLSHIKSMLLQADNFEQGIQDFDALIFAIWYHDIIYKPTKKDNEDKSAIFAENHIKMMLFDQKRLKNIKKLIVSTKKHKIIIGENMDNAYLLDMDLSILGTNWETYENYTQQIRNEYKIYPDFMYKPGRKKVLQHFLVRETLYFTEAYRNKFESQARKNIKKEIELL